MPDERGTDLAVRHDDFDLDVFAPHSTDRIPGPADILDEIRAHPAREFSLCRAFEMCSHNAAFPSSRITSAKRSAAIVCKSRRAISCRLTLRASA